jgi:hypothetical protein
VYEGREWNRAVVEFAGSQPTELLQAQMRVALWNLWCAGWIGCAHGAPRVWREQAIEELTRDQRLLNTLSMKSFRDANLVAYHFYNAGTNCSVIFQDIIRMLLSVLPQDAISQARNPFTIVLLEQFVGSSSSSSSPNHHLVLPSIRDTQQVRRMPLIRPFVSTGMTLDRLSACPVPKPMRKCG